MLMRLILNNILKVYLYMFSLRELIKVK